jgi:glutamate 5-kinase
VIVVSSGSIALGRGGAGAGPGALSLDEAQAAAAVGQIRLARAWEEALAPHGITTAQILLTLDDSGDRRRYLNTRATLAALLGAARCRSSTRTTPSPPTRSAMATMTGWPRRSR